MMARLDIKPLSVNELYKGRRFKTDKYKGYSTAVSVLLPRVKLCEPPYSVEFEFGFSSPLSDVDNPVKGILDILQKKFNFNDRDVFEIIARKKIVKKGKEYIKIKIEKYEIVT